MYIQFTTINGKVRTMGVHSLEAQTWKKALEDAGAKTVKIKQGEICQYKHKQPKGSD